MDVPEELKQSLKGENEETNKTNDSSIHEGNVMDDMLSSQKSNAEAIENSDLMKQVIQAIFKNQVFSL